MTDDIAAARERMIAKRFGGAKTSTGGKGSVRRKKKSSSRGGASAQSDVKLNSALKKLGANSIPGIEEVNFFKEDGKVIHFVNPKVQASIQANTYIISGRSETKPLQELLPSLMGQLGASELAQLQGMGGMPGGMPGMPGGMPGMPGDMPNMGGVVEDDDDDDDDDVPDLVEGNFEDVSNA